MQGRTARALYDIDVKNIFYVFYYFYNMFLLSSCFTNSITLRDTRYTATTVQLDTLFRWFYCHTTTSSPMWFVIRFAINKDLCRHLSHPRQCYMSPCNNCRDILHKSAEQKKVYKFAYILFIFIHA